MREGTTQDVRQAILVVNPQYDNSQITEQLALFDGISGEPYPFAGETWIDIADSDMQTGWTHLDGSPQPQYRKRPNGQVELRGAVAGGELGTIFTLPEDYRHNYDYELGFPSVGLMGGAYVCIYPNGNVEMRAAYGGVGAWYSLASIIFSNS
jgi:hypothetical protein